MKGETVEAKLIRLEEARRGIGKLLGAFRRRAKHDTIHLALIERRLSHVMQAMRMIRETGRVETGLPSIEEIRQEIIYEMNTGEYFDNKQREQEEFNASWYSRPTKPKL